MNPTYRRIVAVVAGIGIGGVLIFAVEFVNSLVFPLPADVSPEDPVALAEAMADAGPRVLVGVAVGWFVGAFTGTFIATRVAQTRSRIPGGIVTVFFLLGSLTTLTAFPHPMWFWVVGLTAVTGGGHLGHAVGAGPARPVADGGTKDAPFR